MRIWASSDIHIDYAENREWMHGLSNHDYKDDVLILAGDVSHKQALIRETFAALAQKFKQVFYVPGNHELWVRHEDGIDSIAKFSLLLDMAEECGVKTQVSTLGGITFVPLFSWYDYSFGQPSRKLLDAWMDFRCCVWPSGIEPCDYFLGLNLPRLDTALSKKLEGPIISFSHFLPRIDLMPDRIPQEKRFIYPVLGSVRLDKQLRHIQPAVHVYGHSHVNRDVVLDSTRYINCAYAYPSETRISAKQLKLIEVLEPIV